MMRSRKINGSMMRSRKIKQDDSFKIKNGSGSWKSWINLSARRILEWELEFGRAHRASHSLLSTLGTLAASHEFQLQVPNLLGTRQSPNSNFQIMIYIESAFSWLQRAWQALYFNIAALPFFLARPNKNICCVVESR